MACQIVCKSQHAPDGLEDYYSVGCTAGVWRYLRESNHSLHPIMAKQSVHILIVEDDPIDAENIIRTFQRYQIDNPYTHVVDGIEALHALRGERGYEPVPKPYIILLDINMPRMNGLEFLSALRRDPALKQSVVFVLTTSNRDEDVTAAYNKQIAGYLLKSKVSEDFLQFIKLLNLYRVMIEMPR